MTSGITGQTAREQRAHWRATFSRFFRGVLHRHDVTQETIARLVGTQQSKVAAWLDPEHAEVPGVPDIALMPQPVAVELLAWLGEHHRVHVVAEVRTETVGDHLGHLHAIVREGADVTSLYSKALADGVIDDAEADALLRELDESIAAETALRRTLLERKRVEVERRSSVRPMGAGRQV